MHHTQHHTQRYQKPGNRSAGPGHYFILLIIYCAGISAEPSETRITSFEPGHFSNTEGIKTNRASVVLAIFHRADSAQKALPVMQKLMGLQLVVVEMKNEQPHAYQVMTVPIENESLTAEHLQLARRVNPKAWIYRSEQPLRNSPASIPEAAPQARTVVVTSSNRKKPKKKSSFVPPGFEELLEPQTTEIDVYFGGLFLTSILATYTPTEITFLQPDELVSRIPDLLVPEEILELLSSPQPANSALACLKSNQTDCGNISTDSLEVIFDENNFRADIFIGSQLLAVRDVNINKFLPKSSAGASLLHQVNATYTGVEGSVSNFNIGNSTTLAYKEIRLLALSNITKRENFTIDTLALEREISGALYQAGFFRSSPANLVFVNETDFAGFTIGSSLDTRKDLDQSAGNELQLFLDSRSRVDILKDGRLVSTQIYNAGNQILDTSQLPGGAYDILLRIRDSFGRVREETRFYLKTNDLPPLDQTLYFFDFGELVSKEQDKTLPTTTGESLIRAGISKRLRQDFGGQIGVMRQEDNTVIEAGIFKLGRIYDLNLNVASGNNDDTGINLNARLRAGRTTLNANLRRTWIDNTQSLLGQQTIQGTINLTFPLGRGLLNLSGRYNDQQSGTEKNVGLRYDFPTYKLGRSIFDLDLQVTRDNGNLLVLLGLKFRQTRGRWRNEITSQYFLDEPETGSQNSGFINNVNTSWNDGDRYISDVTWNMRLIDEQDDDGVETELEIASDYGRLNMDVAYSSEADQLSYGATLNTTFIANKDTIAMGGRSQARSALVMDIQGDVDDAYFDVRVNGSIRGSAKIGTRTVIGIQPYETYEVDLLPRGDSLVDFNDQIQVATLYPGNVVTMSFRAKKVFVAFGQIVDPDGNPIVNALIKGVAGLATTDEFGLFQAEIDSFTRELEVRTRTNQCQVTLPLIRTDELVVALGELACY